MYPLHKMARWCSIALLVPCLALALQDDNKEPMHIVADSSTFNYKTGTNTYVGHVKIDQGTTHLTADRVVTNNNKQHKIELAIAYGITNLAEYTTVPNKGDKVFHAKAKTISFYPFKSTVQLEGNVIVTQGESSFQGPIIIYNMKDQTINVPESKSGRATVILEPKQFSS